MIYVVVQWPEIQHFMDTYGFEYHSHLINDAAGMEKFGSSAYFIEKEWYDEVCRCKSCI